MRNWARVKVTWGDGGAIGDRNSIGGCVGVRRLPSFSTFKVVVSQSASDHISPTTATKTVRRGGSFSGAYRKMHGETEMD